MGKAPIAELRSVLAGFGEFSKAVHDGTDYLPAPGSPADLEWSADKTYKDVHVTYTMASQYLMAAESHLFAAARVLDEPVPEIGFLGTCRSALENSVRAWWLWEPKVPLRVRIGRGYSARLRSLHETVVLEQLFKRPEAKQAEREAEISQRAKDLGYRVDYSKRSGYLLPEIRWPSATELCRSLDPDLGSFTYKFLSAYTHGTSYAVMQGMKVTESLLGGMGHIAEPDGDFYWMGFAAFMAGRAYLHAFDRHAFLFGQNIPEWIAWRGHAMKVLVSAVPEERMSRG